MDKQTRSSLERLVSYVYSEEAMDYEDQQCPDEHIFNDIKLVEDWLSRTMALSH